MRSDIRQAQMWPNDVIQGAVGLNLTPECSMFQNLTSKAVPHMGSSHNGPAAVASWKPVARPDWMLCSTCMGTPLAIPARCSGGLTAARCCEAQHAGGQALIECDVNYLHVCLHIEKKNFSVEQMIMDVKSA